MHPALSADRVALVTGAASGIGRAAARRLVSLGMRIVLVDITPQKLADAEAEMIELAGGDDARVQASLTDVSDFEAMRGLAHRVAREWEPPSLLMNNAAKFVHGGAGGGIFDSPDDWRAVFDVNLWGVVNGVAAFATGMIEAGGPRLIVNTGSKQGITLPPGNACYDTVKAALNAYTQLLAHELRNRQGCALTAHLLVPGWTTTGDSEHQTGAWLPDQVIDYMLTALDKGDFFIICPDDETTSEMDRKRILWHALDMIENRPALSRWHPDFADAFAEHMKRQLPPV